MAEAHKPFFKGAQVRVEGSKQTMIVSVASPKLAICHWVSGGEKREGVFDARALEPFSAGQQHDLWTVTAPEEAPGIEDGGGPGII